jgi:dihydroxy-acid dehydratase
MADKKGVNGKGRRLRSRDWFDAPGDPTMAALYLERYLNFGLTLAELHSNRPIIGIAQTGSDLSPCNRHHLQLAERVRDGIRDAGGIPIEFPSIPSRRRQAADRRRSTATSPISAWSKSLYGYFFDGVVLTTGCDKTTPAMIMGACTVNIPSIVLSGGPMLDGHYAGGLAGSGTVVWYAPPGAGGGPHRPEAVPRDGGLERARASGTATPWARRCR